MDDEWLDISQPVARDEHADPVTRDRYLRLNATPGPLRVHHEATVSEMHHVAAPGSIGEVPVGARPADVLPCLHPSRY